MRGRASDGRGAATWRAAVAAFVASAVEYLGVLALVEGLHMAPGSATHLGYVVGAGVNFALNRRWAFASRQAIWGEALRYAGVSVLGGLWAACVVEMLARLLWVDYRLGVPLAYAAVSLGWNLPLQGRFVFAQGATARRP